MKRFPAAAAICGLFVMQSSCFAADSLDEMFKTWGKSKTKVQSLTVEFTRDIKPLFGSPREYSQGSFKLLRGQKGELWMAYDVERKTAKAIAASRVTILLNDDKLYLLDYEQKATTEFPNGTNIATWIFMETNFFPVVTLMNQLQTEAKFDVKLVKQDQWYTYVLMTPKEREISNLWLSPQYCATKAVFATQQKTPRQVAGVFLGQQFSVDVKSWKVNDAKGPKHDDFALPKESEGWTKSLCGVDKLNP